jgi:hypothetical protein
MLETQHAHYRHPVTMHAYRSFSSSALPSPRTRSIAFTVWRRGWRRDVGELRARARVVEWRLGISKSRADALDDDAQPQPPNRELARNEVLPLCQEGLVVAVHVVAARVLRIRDWQPIAN